MLSLTLTLALVCVALGHEPAKSATIEVENHQITFTTDTGETTTFQPAANRPLGDDHTEDDPDTFRGKGRGGSDVIVFRLKGDKGARTFDEDGIANIADHSYTLKLDGEIKEEGGKLSFKVNLEVPEVDSTKKGDKSDNDEKAPEPVVVEVEGARKKRASSLLLQLAIFVDQGFWDAYSKKYGRSAKAKVDSFVQGMLDVMESDYNGLSPRVDIEVEKYEVWKKQPSFTREAKKGGSVDNYLTNLKGSAYCPKALKTVDHTMVLSGYGLLDKSTLGIAFTGTLCNNPDTAVSVMNNMAMTVGETAAHELGHSFGIKHDGDSDGKYESKCPQSGFLMAAYITEGQTDDLLFSRCSRLRVQNSIKEWNDKSINCLENKKGTVNCNDSGSVRPPCSQLARGCHQANIQQYCPKTCGKC